MRPSNFVRSQVVICCVSLLTLMAVTTFSTAQTTPSFRVVYAFGANATDGQNPTGKLALDSLGNLYGTTEFGGTGTCSPGPNCGTIFKIDPTTGVETVLYRFTGKADGALPYAGVILDGEGNLYGTTLGGGDTTKCTGTGGCGVIFKLDTSGTLTVLHTLELGLDGATPTGGLVARNGELYGVTEEGGSPTTCNPPDGCGTIFKVSESGDKYHVIYRFTGGTDGTSPASVITDTAGNLYGTTNPQGGKGTVFELTSAGTFTTLYSFPGGLSGENPAGRLFRDANGNIHGTATNGGSPKCTAGGNVGCGLVYTLHTDGTEAVLHRFGTVAGDGNFPFAGIVDKGGALFSTTTYGGNTSDCFGNGCGVVFEIAGDNTYSILYTFTGGTDGNYPRELTLDPAGNLYGAAFLGGANSDGVVYEVTP